MGDVSCLATEPLGPDCCHDNMAGYHVENREGGGDEKDRNEQKKKNV